MSLTEEQKEIIRSSIEDFDIKFSKIKIEFLNMGYKQNDAEDLAWASFVMVNANVTPEEYDFYYKEICKK